MLGLLRSLPYMLVVGALAYGAHWFIVNQLENRIITLENHLEQSRTENIALQTASQTCEKTVETLEETITEQQADIKSMSITNQEIIQERDSYLSIFRRHDLTKLSLAKPGLIEPRINAGTKAVFDQVEQDTQHEETDTNTLLDNN